MERELLAVLAPFDGGRLYCIASLYCIHIDSLLEGLDRNGTCDIHDYPQNCRPDAKCVLFFIFASRKIIELVAILFIYKMYTLSYVASYDIAINNLFRTNRRDRERMKKRTFITRALEQSRF